VKAVIFCFSDFQYGIAKCDSANNKNLNFTEEPVAPERGAAAASLHDPTMTMTEATTWSVKFV
jgi:hypothetical protein